MKRILALFLALLALSGCSAPLHARHLEGLQSVQTLGFDGEPGAVTVSVSGQEEGLRMAARGESVVRSWEELKNFAPRGELFFSHARFALIGEEAARAGIGEVLDWFCRSAQSRLILPLFLVQGEARELVTGSEDENFEITGQLSSLVKHTERQGELCCFTVLDTVKHLNEYGAALCCGLRPVEPGANAPSAEEGALSALTLGYAVLRGDKLLGWLDEEQSRGATLLLNKAGEISYTLPEGAAVTLRSAKAKLAPEKGLAKLSVTAGLTGLWGSGELTEERLAALERSLAEILAGECAAALRASSEMEADFLGLGAADASGFTVRVRAKIARSFDTVAAPLKEASNGE